MIALRISLIAFLLLASPTTAAPSALTDVRMQATIERDTGGGFEVDAAGRLFTVDRRELSVWSPQGTLLARWAAPPPESFHTTLVTTVSPAGDVFVADYEGRTIHRHDANGHLLGSWSPVRPVTSLAYDPRGSIVTSNSAATDRYTDDGTYLGTVAGASGEVTRFGDGGRRWTAEGTVLGGYAPSGMQIGRIGTPCAIGGRGPSSCPSGPGTFGTEPPLRFDAGNGLIAAAGGSRVQLFDARGRGLFSCEARDLVPAGVVDVAIRSPRDLLLLDYDGAVLSARINDGRARGCRRMPLRVTRVRTHRRPRVITYRLSHRAAVDLVLTRVDPVRCDPIPDRFDPGARCVAQRTQLTRSAPGRAGRNRVAVPRCARRECATRGRWLVQVRALDARGRQSAPPPVEVRF